MQQRRRFQKRQGVGRALRLWLIQVKDQIHLWSTDYNYSVKDILGIEDDVAKAVAHEVQLRLTSSQQQAELTQSHTGNPEAFDAYLQGYYFFQRNTDKDTDRAAEYYEPRLSKLGFRFVKEKR